MDFSSRCRGQVEIAKLLLTHPDIDVNSKNTYGQIPILLGCWNGHVSVVELLLKDLRVDTTLDDNKGCTPLWWAACYGQHEVIEWLIASGRDLGDTENKRGKRWDGKEYTALEIARLVKH